MTEVSRGPRERPLSPHLQVWRWHVTMLTSILHRVTGVGLYAGALVLAVWAICLAAGSEPYHAFMQVMASPIGRLFLFGETVALFYHLANGVRHLVWDAGEGFEIKTADFTGIVAIAFGVAAAVAVWVIAYLTGAI